MSPSPLGRLLFGSPWTGPGAQETHRSPHSAGWLTTACAGRLAAGRPWGLVCVRAAGRWLRRPHQPRLWPPQREQSCSSAFQGTLSYRLPAGKREPDRLCEGRPPCSKATAKPGFNHKTQNGTRDWPPPLSVSTFLMSRVDPCAVRTVPVQVSQVNEDIATSPSGSQTPAGFSLDAAAVTRGAAACSRRRWALPSCCRGPGGHRAGRARRSRGHTLPAVFTQLSPRPLRPGFGLRG